MTLLIQTWNSQYEKVETREDNLRILSSGLITYIITKIIEQYGW